MKRAAFLVIALLAGCTQVRPCKKNTLFLVVNYDATTAQADGLDIQLALAGTNTDSYHVAHTPGSRSGSLEIDFAGGYQPGAALTVGIRASAGGMLLAVATQAITLSATCTHASFDLSGTGSGTDGGVTLAQNGDSCASGVECASGNCADTVCCDRACDGTCEACGESGSVGTCMTVSGSPRGSRAACGGTGNCAGMCDGTNAKTCTFGTATCMQSCTAGSSVTATCANGTCGTPMSAHCTGNICGMNACATVAKIVTGYLFTCAMMSDGSVKCWGNNSRGQLAQGATDSTTRYVPTTVPGLTGVTDIAAGQWHVCAISGGSVYCWGGNYNGQLGQGTRNLTENNDPPHGSVPMKVPGLSNVKHIAAGISGDTTCAVMADTTVQCWGDNGSGLTGDGTSGNVRPSPVQVCASGTGISCVPFMKAQQVALGTAHTCALTTDDKVYCWGDNSAYQLGFNTDQSTHPNPILVTTVPDTGTTISMISLGSVASCVVESSGIIKCWGGNGGTAAFGTGTNGPSTTATPVTVCQTYNGTSCTMNLTGVSQMAMSGYGGCAVASAGRVFCWGYNMTGQVGNGTSSSNAVLLAVGTGIAQGAATIAGEFQHWCAQMSDGTAACWGADDVGEIGDNDSTTKSPKTLPTTPQW